MVLSVVRGLVGRGFAVIRGGWYDIVPVVMRLAALIRDAPSRPDQVQGSGLCRARARLDGLGAALRRRR